MARISGINLPLNKRAEIGLTYIFGIGKSTSNKILETVKIDKNKLIKDLSEGEVEKVRSIIEKNYKAEGVLKRQILDNIKRLKQINSYRGTRHSKRLPVRGQRTKTNARTIRGNVRKKGASGKKASGKKV